LWNIGDPQKFCREPLTVALAVDAQVTPFFDFLDPAQRESCRCPTFPVKRMVFKLPN
jgi:hypothetical protein